MHLPAGSCFAAAVIHIHQHTSTPTLNFRRIHTHTHTQHPRIFSRRGDTMTITAAAVSHHAPAAARLASLSVRPCLPLAVAVHILPRLVLLLPPHLKKKKTRERKKLNNTQHHHVFFVTGLPLLKGGRTQPKRSGIISMNMPLPRDIWCASSLMLRPPSIQLSLVKQPVVHENKASTLLLHTESVIT